MSKRICRWCHLPKRIRRGIAFCIDCDREPLQTSLANKRPKNK